MRGRAIIPATIGGLPFRQGAAFLSLFFLPTVAQATLLTVLPLGALRLLGTAQAVTLLYGGAGLAAVVGRFSIPALVRLVGRRAVFTLGAVSLATSSALFAGRKPTVSRRMSWLQELSPASASPKAIVLLVPSVTSLSL